VYAVKFGTAQKLGYGCDQALAVLEILRNQANVREIPHFERYCLWLGYRVAGDTPLQNISLSGSIILKQKIENWARKCCELGITPVIRSAGGYGHPFSVLLARPGRRGFDGRAALSHPRHPDATARVVAIGFPGHRLRENGLFDGGFRARLSA
jgi:hypothetical protein